LFDGQGDAAHGAMPMSASCPRPIGRTIAGATGDGFQIGAQLMINALRASLALS
jgi:hypothetical protein